MARVLLIVGGGAVGVEMAQAWKTLGADEVTIVELHDRLLASEEPFAGAELQDSFEKLGIRVLTNASTTRIGRQGSDGPVTAHIALADEAHDPSGHQPGDQIGRDEQRTPAFALGDVDAFV